MIKRLLTIYVPAAVVLATATLAAVFLFKDADPELENVEFVTTENAEIEEGNRITENAEEAEIVQIFSPEADTAVGVIQELPLQFEESSDRTNIRSVTVEQIEPVIVMISGPGVSIRCELEAVENETVHQVMKQAADQCGFSYQTTQHASFGVFVEGLGGVASDKKAGLYWIYSVNGVKANVGVSSYPITPGDIVSWNYEPEYN